MSSLDSMYSRLRSLSGYNSSSNEVKKYLNLAYEYLGDSYDLSKVFLVDDVAVDNGKILKIREDISSICRDLNIEIEQVNQMISSQQVAIRREENRLKAEENATDDGETSKNTIPSKKLHRLE